MRVEGDEVDEIVEMAAADPIEENSRWKGGVGTRGERKARWKVVIAERPSIGESVGLSESVRGEQTKKMEDEKEVCNLGQEGLETTQIVQEGVKCYEEFEKSGRMDDEVVIVKEEIWNVSTKIAVKAMMFGGIREGRDVVIV